MNESFQNVFLRTEKLSNQVKDVLKHAILKGEFKPGDKLPPETQLVDQLKVSKVTIREALNEMESEGLIEKRRGIYGGSFVAQPGSNKIGQVMNNFYQFGGLTPEEMVQFRQILEPELVAMAVEHRTKEDLKAMKINIQEVEEAINKGTPDQAKGIHFHCLIANACHNRLTSAIMSALVKVFLEVLSKVPMTLEDARGDLEYNKKFYQFMLNGQKQEARQLMVTHFKTLTEIIERSKKEDVINIHDL
ncbi:MAG: FadR family transcriptional regulator [Deltaproteobacteria bacterium]|uniref:FadR/GntR family transcriptional regulator n=1 Tax=Desulfobacula sp. TaxID=2593537 RepID=UPI0019959D15|nr:FadR family transcriptional regulator [Candidatus Desulfobacula maris]MBL6994333.1 FadR family transcriptional regulator [Desulfobacula sp.]